MGKKIVVANLKMSMNTSDINIYLKSIKNLNNKNVVICPTSIYIPYFLKQHFYVGIQNVYKEDLGAYTGEVSPLQAYTMGVRYVILGHSERRNYFKEMVIVTSPVPNAAFKSAWDALSILPKRVKFQELRS